MSYLFFLAHPPLKLGFQREVLLGFIQLWLYNHYQYPAMNWNWSARDSGLLPASGRTDFVLVHIWSVSLTLTIQVTAPCQGMAASKRHTLYFPKFGDQRKNIQNSEFALWKGCFVLFCTKLRLGGIIFSFMSSCSIHKYQFHKMMITVVMTINFQIFLFIYILTWNIVIDWLKGPFLKYESEFLSLIIWNHTLTVH